MKKSTYCFARVDNLIDHTTISENLEYHYQRNSQAGSELILISFFILLVHHDVLSSNNSIVEYTSDND